MLFIEFRLSCPGVSGQWDLLLCLASLILDPEVQMSGPGQVELRKLGFHFGFVNGLGLRWAGLWRTGRWVDDGQVFRREMALDWTMNLFHKLGSF